MDEIIKKLREIAAKKTNYEESGDSMDFLFGENPDDAYRYGENDGEIQLARCLLLSIDIDKGLEKK